MYVEADLLILPSNIHFDFTLHSLKYKLSLITDFISVPRVFYFYLFFYFHKLNRYEYILEVLRVQGEKMGLKINAKKTKSLRLGISKGGDK